MKNLFENWKKFINEGPLDDIQGYSTNLSKPSIPSIKNLRKIRGSTKSSIGHTQLKKPEFIQSVRSIMQNTKNKWVIITLKQVGVVDQYDEEINKQKFEEWLKEKNYPKDAIILVVKDTPFKNDFNTPEWFIHDVIGHAAARNFIPSGLYHQAHIDRNVIISLHKDVIPKENAPATDDDLVPDIMAAIITGHLTRETANTHVHDKYNDEYKAVNTVQKLFDYAQKWLDNLGIGPDNYNIARIW